MLRVAGVVHNNEMEGTTMKITIKNAKEMYVAGIITYEEYRDVMIKGGVLIIR